MTGSGGPGGPVVLRPPARAAMSQGHENCLITQSYQGTDGGVSGR